MNRLFRHRFPNLLQRLKMTFFYLLKTNLLLQHMKMWKQSADNSMLPRVPVLSHPNGRLKKTYLEQRLMKYFLKALFPAQA